MFERAGIPPAPNISRHGWKSRAWSVHGVRKSVHIGLKVVFAVLVAAVMSEAGRAAEPPGVISREAWGARSANTAIMKAHRPSEIVIHMTGVRSQPKLSLEQKMRGLQGYSQRSATIGKRRRAAWGDVPYHYYVGASGRIAKGRDIGYAGDTNTNYRTAGRIQVVVEGEFDKEKPTARQIAALTRIVSWLAKTYNVPAARITGHNDHAATSCPGKHLKAYLPRLRAAAGG